MTQNTTITCFNCNADLLEQSMFCGSCGINFSQGHTNQVFQSSPYELDPVSRAIYRVLNINLIMGALYVPVIFIIAIASAFSDGGGGNFNRLFLSVIIIEILYIWIRNGLPQRKQNARIVALCIASISLAYGIFLILQFASNGLGTEIPVGLFLLLGFFAPHGIVIRILIDEDVRSQFGSNPQTFSTPVADSSTELSNSGNTMPTPINVDSPNFGLDPVTQSIQSVLSSNLLISIFYGLFALVYLDDVLILKLSGNSVNFLLVISAIIAYTWIRKNLPERNPKARTFAMFVAGISIPIEVYWILNANFVFASWFSILFAVLNIRIIRKLLMEEVKAQFRSSTNLH